MKNVLSAQSTLSVGFFALILFLLPFFSNAYSTTAQSQIDLENGTGLFLIEYKFGHSEHDINIPVIAENGPGHRNTAVSYEILDSRDNPVSGSMFGFVLSNATINENGMYVVSRGSKKTFTLAVIFTPPEDVNTEKYRLQVTHLPFQFNGAQQLQLNSSELEYYTTEKLRL